MNRTILVQAEWEWHKSRAIRSTMDALRSHSAVTIISLGIHPIGATIATLNQISIACATLFNGAEGVKMIGNPATMEMAHNVLSVLSNLDTLR